MYAFIRAAAAPTLHNADTLFYVTDSLSKQSTRTAPKAKLAADARSAVAVLCRELEVEEASGAQVARLVALAHAHEKDEPRLARCALALAIERQHAAREDFHGLRALNNRLLAMKASAQINWGEERFLSILDSLGLFLASLYSVDFDSQLDAAADRLLESASESSADGAHPALHAQLRLRAATALLGYSELKGSAAIRTRIDSIASDAARLLPPTHRDSIDWWAERAVIECFSYSREKNNLARLQALLEAQAERLKTLPNTQTSAHFKWWRVQVDLARLREDPSATESALDALAQAIAPKRAAHLQTYLRVRADFCLHRALPLESERYARESLRIAAEIDAPYTEIATTSNILAVSLSLQARWNEAADVLRDAERVSHGKIALYLQANRRLFESIALWDNDRAEAINALREGFAANRAVLKYGFLLSQPALAATLAARALDHDIEPDFVRESVRRRALPSPSSAHIRWPWRAQVRLFGGFALTSNAPSAKPGSKAQHRPVAILQALALIGPEGGDRKSIIRRVYGSVDAVEPAALDMAIGRARKMLGDDTLIAFEGGRMRLDRRFVFVDVWAFDALDQEIAALSDVVDRGAQRIEEWRRLAKLLTTLYAGPLLYGDSSDIVTDTLVQRYRERFVANAIRVADFLRASHSNDDAFDLLHRAIEREPDSEALYRALIEQLIDQDELAEAMRWYERCESMARHRFGVEVSSKTRALLERLRREGRSE